MDLKSHLVEPMQCQAPNQDQESPQKEWIQFLKDQDQVHSIPLPLINLYPSLPISSKMMMIFRKSFLSSQNQAQ